MQEFSRKEKYLACNTLNCVPLILKNCAVLIDMRNETQVAGRIVEADGHMNITLEEAVFIDRNLQQYAFDSFMVRDRMIRYIRIPASIDMEKELHHWMEHGRRRKPAPKGPRTLKQKRAEEKHKQTLKEIAERKEVKEKGTAQPQ